MQRPPVEIIVGGRQSAHQRADGSVPDNIPIVSPVWDSAQRGDSCESQYKESADKSALQEGESGLDQGHFGEER